jgi:hypothetical protein
MRALIIKNVGEVIKAVTNWDGDSHFNVPRNHTLVLSDDPKMVEGRSVSIAALQAQAKVDAETRASAQKQAEADSQARKLARAKAIVAANPEQPAQQPAA